MELNVGQMKHGDKYMYVKLDVWSTKKMFGNKCIRESLKVA